jgi:hypothetical protein
VSGFVGNISRALGSLYTDAAQPEPLDPQKGTKMGRKWYIFISENETTHSSDVRISTI